MTNEEIAEICHEVNRGLCIALNDHSQNEWHLAPQWARQSAIAGVKYARRPDIEAHPAGSHSSWMRDKLADGWKYGPVKDVGKKIHPCLVQFEDLPPTQQLKDHLFITVCRVLG